MVLIWFDTELDAFLINHIHTCRDLHRGAQLRRTIDQVNKPPVHPCHLMLRHHLVESRQTASDVMGHVAAKVLGEEIGKAIKV